jgi:hypothetical protein
MQVFLVRTNGIVLAAYAQLSHAETHARTITGARVEPMVVLMHIPASVRDDIESDDWSEEPTPVQPDPDITVTHPGTPRAKAKRTKR